MLKRSVENPEEARTDLALLEYSELERRRQRRIAALEIFAWSAFAVSGLLSALAVIYA